MLDTISIILELKKMSSMNKHLYIYHHLGLGDHIICNALVRILSKNYENVTLFCKTHNFLSVSKMYRDLVKVKILLVTDDTEAYNIYSNLDHNVDKVKVGFEYLNGNIKHFDKKFYSQFDIPFIERYNSFYYERDVLIENKVYDLLNPNNKKYLFLHDDKSRGYEINTLDGVDNDLLIIKPDKSLQFTIFDYLKLIENAQEIHCIDSSFKSLIDSININNKNMYFHTYSRGHNYLTSSNNWVLI